MSFPRVEDANLKAVITELSNFQNKNIDLRQNCRVIHKIVTFDVEANVEKTIDHGLSNIVPFMYVYNVDREATIYDSRRSEWDTTNIYLKCTKQNVVANLLIIG